MRLSELKRLGFEYFNETEGVTTYRLGGVEVWVYPDTSVADVVVHLFGYDADGPVSELEIEKDE